MNFQESIPNRQKYVTVQQLSHMLEYSWLTEQSIRHHIFESQPRINSKNEEIKGNGLAPAIGLGFTWVAAADWRGGHSLKF